MKKTLLAMTGLVGLALGGTATAADYARPVYKAPPPPPHPACANFGGFYVGAHVGAARYTNHWSDRDSWAGTLGPLVGSDRREREHEHQDGICRRLDRRLELAGGMFGLRLRGGLELVEHHGRRAPHHQHHLPGRSPWSLDLTLSRCPARSRGTARSARAPASWWTTCSSMSPVAWRQQGSIGVSRSPSQFALLVPGYRRIGNFRL